MKRVNLSEVCEVLDSKRVPITASDRKKGIYPYYGANGIQDYVDDYIFDDELVLLAEDGGNFGSKEKPIAYRVSGKCWVNNHAHVLKPLANVDVDYLCYALMFYDVSSMINGATRKKLTQAEMVKMVIPLRPMDEQVWISKVLKMVDYSISLYKSQIIDLDKIIKSRFIEMFGNPVYNSMKWNTELLCHLGDLNRGVSKHRPRNDPKLLGGIYPLIQTGDVANSDGYIRSYKSTYSEEGLKQSKMWSSGVLCITIAANIAKTAILTFDACFPDSVVGFEAGSKVTNLYIHYWFTFIQKILEEQAPESAQKNINLRILSELNVMVPPIELQNQFADFVVQVDKSKLAVKKSLNELETLKKSLMQEYFG